MGDHLDHFRALAAEAVAEGQRLQVKRCWPWSHAWNTWEDVPLWRWAIDDQWHQVQASNQRRSCLRCGRAQQRRIGP